LNNVSLVGRLVQNPELRKTDKGTPYVKFTLAVDRDFKNKETNEVDADFIDCIVWGVTAENLHKYKIKGEQVSVIGSLRTDLYENKSGDTVKRSEVRVNQLNFVGYKRKEWWIIEDYNENKIEKFLSLFSKESVLRNVQTGATIFFILIFVIYFYGFRTGFDLELIDPIDIITDMTIILIASIVIINDFSKRGMYKELEFNKEIHELEGKHSKLSDDIDEDTFAVNLQYYNDKEINRKELRKKKEIIRKLKQKRRAWLNYPKERKRNRKLNKYDKIIEHIEDENTKVKIKHKWIKESDVLTKGIGERNKGEIDPTYNPAKNVMFSQSGMVLFSTLLVAFVRLTVDPTVESIQELSIFLLILIPFLIIRAVTSYIGARYNTRNRYVFAIRKKISIIKECRKS